MDALDAAAPGSLFLVPGAGQAAAMGGITGAGYSTAVRGAGGDAGAAAQAAAAASFFDALAGRPYARQAVVSPSWQVPSGRAGGAGAPAQPPPAEWAALEDAWGRLSHARPLLLGAFGGPPPPAQLVQATVPEPVAEPVPTTDAGSLSADAAALASLAVWLQPTCGLPACAAAAAVGAASPGGGHVPVRSWAWDAWMVVEEEAAAPSSSSSARPVILGAPPGDGAGSAGGNATAATSLPPVDWSVTAFLGGLGAVPWFAPPTPQWRGPAAAGPDPASMAGGMTPTTAPPAKDEPAPCVATFTISSPGRALVGGGGATHPPRAVGILSLTLTPGDSQQPGGDHGPLTPPYTLVVRPAPGGAYRGLRALAGATDGTLAPGGAALTATVGDPWATLWAPVSVAAVLEADAGGKGDQTPVAALAPGSVSVGGLACRLQAAEPHQADGGRAAAIPSLMQVVVP
jgi:hypothetical protein